jgi:hypothetical protein
MLPGSRWRPWDEFTTPGAARRDQLLDRLMGQTVLAHRNRVVRVDVHDRKLHQRRASAGALKSEKTGIRLERSDSTAPSHSPQPLRPPRARRVQVPPASHGLKVPAPESKPGLGGRRGILAPPKPWHPWTMHSSPPGSPRASPRHWKAREWQCVVNRAALRRSSGPVRRRRRVRVAVLSAMRVPAPGGGGRAYGQRQTGHAPRQAQEIRVLRPTVQRCRRASSAAHCAPLTSPP